MRLDIYLVKSGLAKSRSYAASLIDAGLVEVNGKRALKAAALLDAEKDAVEVTGELYEYVSRGGVKLAAALDEFKVDPAGRCCIDIGASSGGFTHCLLLRGAARVCAVDVGHGQLDPLLRADKRVISIEGVNARQLTADITGEPCSLAVCDVSFISQTYIIPVLPGLLTGDGIYIALIKPQFECGRAALKNGIVRRHSDHFAAIMRVAHCAAENGFGVTGLAASPITGGDGNREYLICCRRGSKETLDEETAKDVCGA